MGQCCCCHPPNVNEDKEAKPTPAVPNTTVRFLSHTLLYMCYTWISSLFPRIKCTPSIPLRDYFLFLSLALSLSLSNMERNPLVELICFNECLLPCWDGIKMSLRERRGRWDPAPLKCLFLSNLPYSPVVNTRDTCTQPRSNKAEVEIHHGEFREFLGWCGLVFM